MKSLIVFYSRTGTTKTVAQKLAEKLNADLEEITDKDTRKGLFGFLRSGKQGMKGLLTKIEPTQKDPAAYDLVVIGTPVWAGRLCSPVRTYLTQNAANCKKVAFFTTQGGNKEQKVFKDMEELCCREPLCKVFFRTAEVKKGEFEAKLADFVKSLS